MHLNLIILLYREPILILSTFTAKYRRVKISARGKNVCSRRVEDNVRSIGQVLTVMGSKEPWITREGVLDICLGFQYRAYPNQDPPPTVSNLSQSRSSATLPPYQPHPSTRN